MRLLELNVPKRPASVAIPSPGILTHVNGAIAPTGRAGWKAPDLRGGAQMNYPIRQKGAMGATWQRQFGV
jgi:hypothetical protein